MTRRQDGRNPATIAYLAPRPAGALRGRLARLLYGLAAWIAGTTPCPVCQELRQRVGAGGRAAERRAWREGWKGGRRGGGHSTPAT